MKRFLLTMFIESGLNIGNMVENTKWYSDYNICLVKDNRV